MKLLFVSALCVAMVGAVAGQQAPMPAAAAADLKVGDPAPDF
jgi:hypothetical protein